MGLKKRLKKNIALMMLGMSLAGAGIALPAEEAYAAEVQATVSSDVKTGVTQDPNSFAERIKRLMADYDAEFNAIQQGTSTRAPLDGMKAEEEMQQEELKELGRAIQPPVLNHNLPVEGTFNFDWKGTPLAESLYAVAKVANKDVVVNGELKGRVFMSLHNVTAERAMELLSSAYNFNWMVENNAILISTSDLMRQSKVFPIHYLANMEKLTNEITALGFESDSVFANSESRTLSVTGTPYQLREVERRLSVIDHPVAQCLVLAQLIEINHGSSLDLGMQYSLPTYSHVANPSPSAESTLRGNFLEKLTFSASSTANRALSKGKVVSRPMVMMTNGQEGVINFGEKVPILTTTTTQASTQVTVEYKDVGTKLSIVPSIDEYTGDVNLKIEAEISAIQGWITSGQTKAPEIATRNTTTSAHLKTGQSLVIGGLMSVTDLDNLSGIPGLMDLPILGELFKFHSHSKTYSEIFIQITPYIVTEGIDPQKIMRQVGEQ